MIARFPFYDENEDPDRFTAVADEVSDTVTAIDDSAFVHNGFWDALCWDITMGDYDT